MSNATIHTKKSKEAPFKAQRRFLNVVYFLDAKKTRSIKVPLGIVKLVATLGALALIWSFISILILGKLTSTVGTLNDELVESNQVIFDYQARFDGVYEKSYPDKYIESLKPYFGMGFTDNDKTRNRDLSSGQAKDVYKNDTPQTKSRSSTMGEDNEILSMGGNHKSVKTDDGIFNNQGAKVFPGLKIKHPRIKYGNESAMLSILLKNSSSEKISGYVWAVAVVDDGSNKKYFTSPDRVLFDEKGVPSNIDILNKFALRNFSSKKFTFAMNQNDIENLKDIKVGLMDKKGLTRNVQIPVSN